MRVSFTGCDARIRRWHPKVAERAARGLNVLLKATQAEPLLELWAEFDVTQNRVVRVVEKSEGKQVFEIVVFAAAAWTSVEAAIPDAVRQLAAVVLARPRVTGAVRGALAPAFKDLPRVTRTRVRGPNDPRQHFTLMAGEALDGDRFLALLDGLDQRLQTEGLGEVTGSGFGVGGWSCDLASHKRQACLRSALSYLRDHGLTRVRILE
jgi:hypothetical protein